MKKTFTTKNKATVAVFMPFVPDRLEVYDSKGQLYFFRDLAPGQDRIKFNIAKADTFTTNVELEAEILPLKIHQLAYKLPPIQKNTFPAGKIKYVFNPKLTGTPARNFYKKGVIEYSPEFKKLSYPIKVFILCHEIGHFYYHDEESADAFGAKLFISKGYNNSTALHALKDVLNFESKKNKERLKKLFDILHR